jgi:DNA (cytosine-5)-methyltransferase 1
VEREDEMSKPPYRVPTMREIEALPWNGYRVASTFSGCGGSCLGYRMAGFRVVYANEFIEEAQRTYKANHPNSFLDIRDIRQVKPEDVMERAGVDRGELDLFDGSPPCSAFSTAGKREAGWGKVKAYSDKAQRVDDLFFEYVRLVDGIRPKVFVAENVSGLVKGTAKGYFKRILAALREPGYRVSCRVLDAQWLGVPQMRQRTIFVGVRDDLGIEPAHPEPLPYRYSLAEALEGVIAQYDPNADISSYAIGKEWDRMAAPGTQSEKYFQLVRPSPHKPVPTITQRGGDRTVASVCHPTEKRKFIALELKRLSGFPDDFILTGSFAQQWERIGRAVPPLMMARIAQTIADKILSKL